MLGDIHPTALETSHGGALGLVSKAGPVHILFECLRAISA